MKSLLPLICVIAVSILVVGNILSVYDAPTTCPCGATCDCGEGQDCDCPPPVPATEVTYTISSLPEEPKAEEVKEEPTAPVVDPCHLYHAGDVKEHPGKGRYVLEWKWYPEKSVVKAKPPIASPPATTYSDDCPDGVCNTVSPPRRLRLRNR